MSRYKVGDLVEVFFAKRGKTSESNRLQIVEVIPDKRGGETIYTGVRVMDFTKWSEFKKKKPALAEVLEKDFLESQIAAHSKT